MRTPIMAANWKMHKTAAEAVAFADDFLPRVAGAADVEIVIAAPFTALDRLGRALDGSNVALAAQNVNAAEKGAFTGEVAAAMLVELGCRYGIVGHSERRSLYGESDATVASKAFALFAAGIRPILCVGETLEEREAGRTLDVVGGSLGASLEGVPAERAREIVIAYEPVWAIGTGKTATPEMAQEVHGFIRKQLAERFGAESLFNRTGMPVHTINTLPKLIWLQRHEPELWRTASQFLLYEGFFLRRMGGQVTISHCLASRTQMYDLATGDWVEDILRECGIDRERLAHLAPAGGGMVGSLRQDLARELGLSQKVSLVSGGHDQACAACGNGVVEAGQAMVSTGTAEVVEVAMDTPALDAKLRKGNISVYRHVVPGLYLAMTLNHSGGLLLRWFRDTVC